MKCPSCKYEDGYSTETHAIVDGDSGDFFTMPVAMERKSKYQYHELHRKVLHACPKCGIAFINVEE